MGWIARFSKLPPGGPDAGRGPLFIIQKSGTKKVLTQATHNYRATSYTTRYGCGYRAQFTHATRSR